MSANGQYKQKLDSIKDDIGFVKESMIPFSTSIGNLTRSIDGLSKNVELMSAQVETFLLYQAKAHDRHREDSYKLIKWQLALIFGLIFGVEGIKTLLSIL